MSAVQRSSDEKLLATALNSGREKQDNKSQVSDWAHSELRPQRAKQNQLTHVAHLSRPGRDGDRDKSTFKAEE